MDVVQEYALCTIIPKVNWADGTEHNLLQTADKRSDWGVEEPLIKSLIQEEGSYGKPTLYRSMLCVQ